VQESPLQSESHTVSSSTCMSLSFSTLHSRIHIQNILAQSNKTEPTPTTTALDTADIRSFFPSASNTAYNQQMHRNFTKHRMASEARSKQRRLSKEKKPKKTRMEATMLRTQNVRGLPKTSAKVENWFSIFRGKENYAQAAFTFIQETHATAADGEDLARRNRATWGFNKNAHPMSYWSDNQARAGGVAILLNPYKITVSEPALIELWSPHFITITCEADGLSVLLVNIYAPHTATDREDFFSRLANHRLRHQGPVIVGGDFNCTALPDLDRTYTVTAPQHQSPQLQRWTRAWKLCDALSPFFPDQDASSEDLEDFHARYHTYKYQVQGDQHSCRLDRWYVSDTMTEWIQDLTATDLGGGSDHAAVSLFLADPTHQATTRSQPKLYPPKACAEHAVQELSESAIGFLQEHYETLDTQQATVEAYVEAWELFKIRLTQEIKTTTAVLVSRVNNSFKTKVTRLRQRLRCPRRSHDEIETIQRELVATVTQWQGLKKRKRWAKSVATGGEATKAFFARATISRKSRPIATLRDTPGAPPRAHGDLGNRMADGWKAIFQQPAREPKPELYALPLVPELPQDGARALNEDFSITEIEASIKLCKRTKSGGPDKLWYRDHAAEITPILLTLFNKCYANGVIPPSFQSAIIVCIPKAGRSMDPLRYRPISLLNTDYKIFMRLLATRLKPWLHELVSPSQARDSRRD
jgi:exonuclease III